MKPIWLLDVDGVINASRPGWDAAPYGDWVQSQGIDYKLRWAPQLIKRLRGIIATGDVDVQWCTSWCPDAHLLEDLWGLPELPSALDLSGSETVDEVSRLKIETALRVSLRNPLIWTDDLVVPAEGVLYEALFAAQRALLIRPSSSRGLRPFHFDLIDAFIEKTKEGN